MIILFPSNLYHSVKINKNDYTRISLAFNTFLRGTIGGHEYDVKVWMNTIKKGRFEDTNQMFEKPNSCTFEVKNFDYQNIIKEIRDKL